MRVFIMYICSIEEDQECNKIGSRFPLMGICDKRLLLLHYPNKSETFVHPTRLSFQFDP